MTRMLRSIALMVTLAILAGFPAPAVAEQVVARHVAPGAQVEIDLADVFESGTGEARITHEPRHGSAFVKGTLVTYKTLAGRDGNDRLVAQLGKNAEHVVRVELTIGEPDVSSGEVYDKIGEQLFVLLVVAIFLEIALTTVFRNRRFRRIDGYAGIKTGVSIVVALLVVVVFGLNIFGEVVAAVQGQQTLGAGAKIISYAVTTLIVAGGSGTVYSLYAKLGIRPQIASGKSGAGLEGDGRLIVDIIRKEADPKAPVQVLLNDEFIGKVAPNDTRFGGDGGQQVAAGAYVLKLTSNKVGGDPVFVERAIGIEPGTPLAINIEI